MVTNEYVRFLFYNNRLDGSESIIIEDYTKKLHVDIDKLKYGLKFGQAFQGTSYQDDFAKITGCIYLNNKYIFNKITNDFKSVSLIINDKMFRIVHSVPYSTLRDGGELFICEGAFQNMPDQEQIEQLEKQTPPPIVIENNNDDNNEIPQPKIPIPEPNTTNIKGDLF